MKKKNKSKKVVAVEESSFVATTKGKYILSVSGLFILVIATFLPLLSPNVIINAMDVLTQDYFWANFWQMELKERLAFKTWNPYVNGGAPFGGVLHSIFTPIHFFIYYFFPPNLGISVNGVMHLFFAGIFTLLYARTIGLGFMASFLTAVFFMFSTEMVSLFNAGHVGKISTISIFPLILFTLERAFQKRRLIDFIFVSLALSWQLYEGHIQISFYCCLVVAIYFIWRSINVYNENKDLKYTGKIYLYGTIMVLLFFSVSASSLSSWFEFKEQSDRGSGTAYEFATSWSMPPTELITYVVPQFFGLGMRNYKDPGEIEVFYWGDMPFAQAMDYLGLLPLILALIAVLRFKGRYVYIFLAIAVLFQLLALGKYNPTYPFFYNFLGFKFFRVPKMNLFVTAFFVALMAGAGAQWLLSELQKKDLDFLKKFLYLLSGATGILLIFVLVGHFNQEYFIEYFNNDLKGIGRAHNPALAGKRFSYTLEGMWISVAFLLIGIAVIALRFNGKVKSVVLFAVMAAYFFIDVSLVNYKFINPISIKNNPYISKNTAIEYFEKEKGLYRVLNAVNERSEKFLSYQVTNKYVSYGIQSASGYEAVQLSRYGDILNKINFNNALLDIMNVKYVVMSKSAVRGSVGQRVGKYEIVVDEDVKILKNRGIMPRAYAVHKVANIEDRGKALSVITNQSFKPGEAIVLEDKIDYPLSFEPKPSSESKVNIVSYKNKEILISANMADKGFLFLGDKFYPGWQAYVDGKPVKIHQANYAFRAVYLDEGEHNVKFAYRVSGTYKKCLILSLVSIMLIMIFVAIHRFRPELVKKLEL